VIRGQHHASRTISNGRAVLVVAHPGHELTLAGWLAKIEPAVFVITDGSGQLSRPRLHSTTKVLLRTGARPGSIYGHFSDQEVYEAMLNHDVDLFLRMTFELADWIVLDGIDYVVGDSAEGYNPTHDVCRMIVGGAVELATRLGGRPIGNYEYVVTGRRDDCIAGRCEGTIRLKLDDEALERKLAAALAYPELADEVEAAVRRDGIEAFRWECLHPVNNRKSWTPVEKSKPYYEEHGEARVASGKYQRLVRYAEHIAPLHTALWKAISQSLDTHVGITGVDASSIQFGGREVRHS
jgi:AcrR family transcriptional regulator